MGRVVATALGLALAVLTAQAPAAAASSTKVGGVSNQKTTARAAGEAITPDPAVRRGVLPNGLRYAVMRNQTPKGALSIRLGIDVGSFEENDNERGAAHFVEHLAFNGTRNFPNGGLDRKFAAAGVAFGRDLNAFTSQSETTYYLDVQDPTPEVTDLAFRWLRDVADGVGMDPEVVDAERGVILAEREARIERSEAIRHAVLEFQAPGTRSIGRDPIPSISGIQALQPIHLRRFYERWYRPDNAIVVVVGDLPLDQLEQRVKDAFSSWAPSPMRPRKASIVPVDAKRGPDAMAAVDAKMPTVLSVCRLRPPEAKAEEDMPAVRRRIASEVWRRILDTRLADLRTTSNPPFLSAETMTNDEPEDMSGVCVVAMPMADEWRPTLKAIQAEVRRFAAHGPRESEVRRAMDERRSYVYGAQTQAETRKSSDLATNLMTAGLQQRVVASPDEAVRVFDAVAESLGPEDILERFREEWSGSGPLLSLITPAPLENAVLRAAWAEGESGAAPDQAAARASVAWGYSSFGRAGSVASREAHPEHGFVRFAFANGVVVNFKQTDFEKNAVEVRVRYGAGRREIPNRDYIPAMLGAMQFKMFGLGRHDYEDLKPLFEETGWDAAMSVGDDAFVLSGASTADGLSQQLSLLAAYASDPGFRSSIDARTAAAVDIMYRVYRTDPSAVLAMAITDAVSPESPMRMPPRDQLVKLRSADFERLLKPALVEAPLEITLVGDIEEKKAIRLLSETFGALPPRKEAARTMADTWFQRFPERSMAPIRATHEGSPEKAVAGVLWPLYVAVPERRREEFALALAARIMTDMLLGRVREELGKTYAPAAITYMPDNADQGYLMAIAESYPADIETVITELKAAGARLARGEVTADDLEAVRRPMLVGLKRAESTNERWAAALDGSARDDQGLRDLVGARELFSSITLEEIKAAAARWLAAAPIVVVAEPEAPAKPARAADAKAAVVTPTGRAKSPG